MRATLVVLGVLCSLCINALQAQIPRTLTYQGVLTNADGTPVADGTVALTFRLFDVAEGGTGLWEEVRQVSVVKGIFNVVLGTVNPVALPFDKQYWLGLTVNGGSEMSPRFMLSSSPYSLNSHSTVTEPAAGQGFTVRDQQGNPTHVFDAGGGARHQGKSTFSMPDGTQGDTVIVIRSGNGPALLAVRSDSSQLKAGSRSPLAPLDSPDSYVIGGEAENGTGVFGSSVSGDGVAGYTASGHGVAGYSSGSGMGVLGGSVGGVGVYGTSTSSTGVEGVSTSGTGVSGRSVSQVGIAGTSQTGTAVGGISQSGTGIYGSGTPAGYFDGEVLVSTVNQDQTQQRVLVWSDDRKVRYKTLPPASEFNGVLQGKALVVRTSAGVEVFKVDTTGESFHKGDETFEGDVILKGTGGKGAKLVDAGGTTIAGFGRIDLDTGERIGVYGRGEGPGGLAGVFEGDVEVNGEVYASSLHVVRAPGDTVMHVRADGTSEHSGLETFKAGLQTVLSNGNILKISPSEGLTLKTSGGAFRGHIDPNGNALFAGNVGVAGNLGVGGTLSKASGSFKIDHPLDPTNKFLYHSFVESPDMKNIYDGVAVMDTEGAAVVELPEWFEALNKEFRYQLTAIGSAAPGLHVSEKMRSNQFRIAGGVPGMEVSWQVTGTRKDAYAERHRIPVEEEKPLSERGRYLYPEVFGPSEVSGLPTASAEGPR